MNKSYTKSVVSNCALEPLFSLGPIYPSDFLKNGESPKYNASELSLAFDPESKVVQLTEQPVEEAMWGSFYWYRSKTNPVMVEALNNVALSTVSKIPNRDRQETFLDIASNDGTLLSSLSSNKFYRVGIDPSDYPEAQNNCDLVVRDFFNKEICQDNNIKPRYITCCAMFYDLNNPIQFLKDVYEILEDDGVFTLQLSYTPTMILQTEFGNVCFPSNTIINGVNKKIQDVKVGDYTYNQSGQKVRVKTLYKNKYSGNLIKVKPYYLEEFSSTEEHPILTISKESLINKNFSNTKWKKSVNLSLDDYLVVPKIKEDNNDIKFDLSKYSFNKKDNTSKVNEFTLNENIAWLFGIWLAEGSTNNLDGNSSINFSLNVKEVDYQDKITSILKDEFGYSCKFYSYIGKGRDNFTQGICSFKRMAHFLSSEFGRGAKNKHIPEWLMRAPLNIKMSFLKGLFAGDGFYKNSQIHLHSASKVLCLQVQLMLASMGAMTGISYGAARTTKKKNGDIIRSSESWQVRGKSARISELFNLDNSKNRSKSFYYFEDDCNIYVKLRKIQFEKFKGNVYNFETETNTYLVSNCVVHNCHEHLCYYNLTSLKYLFDRTGFCIQDIELNAVNGGSIRVYLQKDIAPNNFSSIASRDSEKIRINSLLEWEENNGFNSKQKYIDFYNKILRLKEQTVSFIQSEKNKGKEIWGYGASTKAQTLYQFFGLNPGLITKVAEKQECKFGLNMVGTNIPICSEDEMRRVQPDYLLIGPWFFVENFIKREYEYLRKGGKFILPAPHFRIL